MTVPLNISTIWLICWVLTGVDGGGGFGVGASELEDVAEDCGGALALPVLMATGGRFSLLNTVLKTAWLADCVIFLVKNSKFCLSWIVTLSEDDPTTILPLTMEKSARLVSFNVLTKLGQ